jgi:hypothetical protein
MGETARLRDARNAVEKYLGDKTLSGSKQINAEGWGLVGDNVLMT